MPGLLIAQKLSENDLLNLIEGRENALRIPDYYPADLAATVSQRLIDHPRFGHYENATEIGRVGMAFFETVGTDLQDRYHKEARGAIDELRRAFDPYFSPMDRLRLQLQETWPTGAGLLDLDGRATFAGLARVFENGAGALPHQDVLRRDAPNYPMAHALITQMAANVYLRTSDGGGELEVWRERLTDAEHDALRLSGSYGLDRSRLGPPALVIRPEVGDLILFDATRVHAVREARHGVRVTVSCFVGYSGHYRPLSIWS